MKKGTFLMSAGLLLIIAALFLAGYNIWDENRAERELEQNATILEEKISLELEGAVVNEELPDHILYPEMEMPTVEIDGIYYIGKLEVPAYGLELPVIDTWSYSKLKKAPCRYNGSVYTNDMIIAGHNYRSHFSKIRYLALGDDIIFYDVDGNCFEYQVVELETLAGTAVEEMKAGDWDLTLFTCTYGGQSRMAIRCKSL